MNQKPNNDLKPVSATEVIKRIDEAIVYQKEYHRRLQEKENESEPLTMLELVRSTTEKGEEARQAFLKLCQEEDEDLINTYMDSTKDD